MKFCPPKRRIHDCMVILKSCAHIHALWQTTKSCSSYDNRNYREALLMSGALTYSQVLTSRSRKTESEFDGCQKQWRGRKKSNRNNDKSNGCSTQQWQEAPPGRVWSLEPRAWMSLCQQQQEMGSGTLLDPLGANKDSNTLIHTFVHTHTGLRKTSGYPKS